MNPKESGKKPQAREQIGMALIALSTIGTIILPFMPPEKNIAVGAGLLGLWGIGAVALKPYLDPVLNSKSTPCPKK